MALDLTTIKDYPAPEKEYFKEVFEKKQVVIHHTASGGNSIGDMQYLNGDQQGAVNVSFFIDRDGTIYKAFSSKYYAYHLGVPAATFTKFKVKNTCLALHQHSIGIELDSGGWLEKGGYTNGAKKWVKKEEGKFYSYSGSEVKAENVITYPNGFLGQKYYEKYYAPQLARLKELLVYLCDTYKISKDYQSNMWQVSSDALSGKSGVWTHVSYRESGKWDCHPDTELVNTLKSLV